MPVYTFHCPHCSTRLRLQDRRLIGRTINCPDCHQAVELHADPNSGIVGRPASLTNTSPPAANQPNWHRRWLAALCSPLGAAWIVATVLSAGLAALFVVTSPPAQETRTESPAGPPDMPAATAPSSGDPEAPEPNTTEGRLLALDRLVSDHLARTGFWPRGAHDSSELAPDDRLSWLATIAAHADSRGPDPHWDRAWNDPLNARFVRQRQDAFLNPAIEQQSGQDRYPTSHFVGVTGHGEDSELLPTGHPRAGIFGMNRSTSPADVADGLANTMMIAGVDEKLGAWAAAGASTIRGFTTEPYVNGPDGFGTGQPDGMFVLMADGSVRFLAGDVDPEIVRRMAAKSDGLPLDASDPDVPAVVRDQPAPPDAGLPEANKSEPPEEPMAAKPEPAANPFEITDLVAELAGGGDLPIEVPLADDDVGTEENVGDIAARLEQPIARFDQTVPVAARQLLQSLEEMAAVSLELDQLPEEVRQRLSQPVTVTLADTTVGGILAAALRQLGLRYEIQQERVAILPIDETQ